MPYKTGTNSQNVKAIKRTMKNLHDIWTQKPETLRIKYYLLLFNTKKYFHEIKSL